jgi:hypothetical protein
MSSHNNTTSVAFAPQISDAVVARVGAVESLLRLVAQMPAEDPPVGLAQRTLERIHRAEHRAVAPAVQAPALGQGPQHA